MISRKNANLARTFLGFTLTLQTLGAHASEVLHPTLVEIYYLREVIGYCGLGAEGLKQGFNKELKSVLERYSLSENALMSHQNQAAKDAYAEWQNRGLGGFRTWCQTEGFDAIERFTGARPTAN